MHLFTFSDFSVFQCFKVRVNPNPTDDECRGIDFVYTFFKRVITPLCCCILCFCVARYCKV